MHILTHIFLIDVESLMKTSPRLTCLRIVLLVSTNRVANNTFFPRVRHKMHSSIIQQFPTSTSYTQTKHSRCANISRVSQINMFGVYKYSNRRVLPGNDSPGRSNDLRFCFIHFYSTHMYTTYVCTHIILHINLPWVSIKAGSF